MQYEIKGSLIAKSPKQAGQKTNGSQWEKQEFAIQTLESQYPKKVAITAFNAIIDQLKAFKKNDVIKVSFSIESRQYQERWYTELRAIKIESEYRMADSPATPPRRQTAPANTQRSHDRQSYGYEPEDADRFADDSDPF